MSEVLTTPIKLYYCDDPEAMTALVEQLLMTSAWFDVRIPRDHRWQISFNSEHTLRPMPKKLAAALIEPPTTQQLQEQRYIKSLAAHKAARRKEMKGKRR